MFVFRVDGLQSLRRNDANVSSIHVGDIPQAELSCKVSVAKTTASRGEVCNGSGRFRNPSVLELAAHFIQNMPLLSNLTRIIDPQQ